MIREACVDNLEAAILAEQHGADQIELCSRLDLDGLSPDYQTILAALQRLNVPVKVMIRPRSDDFIYNAREFNAMLDTLDRCRDIGVRRVVTGISMQNGRLDMKRIRTFCAHAAPIRVTIHKAIDESPYLVTDAHLLKSIPNVEAILTSGGAPTALEGLDMLKMLIGATDGKPMIIAAGRITAENLPEIHNLLKAEAYHGRKIV